VSAQRSKLLNAVYSWCDAPADAPLSEGGLPMQLAFEVLTGIEDELLRDLDLSDQNRRVDKFEIRNFQQDGTFTVPRSDYSAPAYAFLQLDSDRDTSIWYPVEVTNHGAIVQAGRDGRLAVGFYGTPPKGQVSWEPESGQTLRVWYDRSDEDVPLLAGETEVGSLYDSLLTLQAGAQCRELMDLPVGEVLKARLVKGMRQWERSVSTSRQQGVVAKTPVWTPRRYRRGTANRLGFRLP
jgi:hypothetical protein